MDILQGNNLYYLIGGGCGALILLGILLIICICCIKRRIRTQREIKRAKSEKRKGSWHWQAQQKVNKPAGYPTTVANPNPIPPPNMHSTPVNTLPPVTNLPPVTPDFIDIAHREALDIPEFGPGRSPGTPYSEPYEHISMRQMSDTGSKSGYSTCTPDSPVSRERLDTGTSAASFSMILRDRLDTGRSISPGMQRVMKDNSPDRESIIEKQVFDVIFGEDRKSRGSSSPKSLTRTHNIDSRTSSVRRQHSPGLISPSSRAYNRQSWSNHSYGSSAAHSRTSSFGNRSDVGVSRHSSKASSKSQHSFRVQMPRQSSIEEQEPEIPDTYAVPNKKIVSRSQSAGSPQMKRNPSPVTPTRKHYIQREHENFSRQFSITSNPAYIQQNELSTDRMCKVSCKPKEQYLDYANVGDESDADYANLAEDEHLPNHGVYNIGLPPIHRPAPPISYV